MAVTETIQELLQGIDDAQYGRDMRQFIHDAIQKCYEDGRAGATDLEARNDIADILDNFNTFGTWYKLPCDVLTSDLFTVENDLIINPTLKLCELSFKATRTSSESPSVSVGNVALALPVMSYMRDGDAYSIRGRSERFFPVYASDGANCFGTIFNRNVSDSTPVAKEAYVEVIGTPAVGHYVCGRILYPYVKFSTSYDMDDAVIINN